MKILLLLTCCIATLQGLDEWTSFKIHYEKNYGNSLEELKRMNIFNENKQMIAAHNARFAQGLENYSLKMNAFSDLEPHEVKTNFYSIDNNRGENLLHVTSDQQSSCVDWRTTGAVGPVEDQGALGNAEIISALGCLESLWFLKTGNMVQLSKQNLIDCCTFGNYFDCISNMTGVDTEASYPTGQEGTCRFDPKNIGATDYGHIDISSGDELALEAAVANIGPILTAIDASHASFQFYSSGVYDDPDCSPTNLDHSVLIVGFCSEAGVDYWLVKNSWGSSWGESGYMKMRRNNNNKCGIATMASYPIV